MASQEHLRQKQATIDEISEKLGKASSVVVIDYIGITVAQADEMRNKLRDAGVDYKVYKNTLVKRAIDGTDNAGLADVLDGPSAFAFGYEDATAPARVLDGVMRDFKKMSFKAGLVEGVLYDADGIKQIATIPSREVLIAKFLGSIQSPIGKLVRTFAAIADADGAPTPEAAVAEEAAAEAVTEETTPAEAEAVAEEAAAEAPPAEEAPEAEAAVEAPPAEEAPEAEAAVEAIAEEAAPEVAVTEEVAEEAPAEEAAAEAPEEE